MDNVSSIAELLAISWTYVSKLLSFVNYATKVMQLSNADGENP